MKDIQSTSFDPKEGEYYIDFKDRLIQIQKVDIALVKGSDNKSYIINAIDHNGKKVNIATQNLKMLLKKRVDDISEYPEYFV